MRRNTIVIIVIPTMSPIAVAMGCTSTNALIAEVAGGFEVSHPIKPDTIPVKNMFSVVKYFMVIYQLLIDEQ